MCLRRVAFVSLFVPLALTAQAVHQRDEVPLRNWPVPSHWQPPATVHTDGPTPVSPENLTDLVLAFVGITPCREVDTRAGNPSGPLPSGDGPPSIVGGATREFILTGNCDVPPGATAVSVNVTIVNPAGPGFASLWQSGTPQPTAATIVYSTGQLVSNAAIVPLGADGGVDFFSLANTDLVVDINAYFTPNNLLTNNSGNTVLGTDAGEGLSLINSSGIDNTLFGVNAGTAITTGTSNTAVGYNALAANTTGGQNTFVGEDAGQNLIAGGNNIGIGDGAAGNLVVGSNNIHIGAQAGGVTEMNTTRIGTPSNATNPNGQNTVFIAGAGSPLTGTSLGSLVVNTATGQIGIGPSSSARYKEDIHDMAGASDGLLRLRPVTFRYKKAEADGSKPLDYGLIAEEVAEVYPSLAVKGADGKIETVQYQKLTPMLLNEYQKQHDELVQLKEANRKLEERLAALEALMNR